MSCDEKIAVACHRPCGPFVSSAKEGRMQQSSPRSRLRPALGLALGLAHIGLGLWLVIAPLSFYSTYPGVVETGPFNPHFVRDIGCAYLVSGGAVIAFALDLRARAAVLAGGAFLALHALVHLWDAAAGRETLGQLLRDLPSVALPALLVLWLALHPSRSRQEKRYVEMADPAAHRRL
jgi:hypothetical protein